MLPSPDSGMEEGVKLKKLLLSQTTGHPPNASFASPPGLGFAQPAYPGLAISFAIITIVSIAVNIGVLSHILQRRLYRNFVSSHFIGHLIGTSLITCIYPLPVFFYTLGTGHNLFENAGLACRFHAFFYCTVWTVLHFMIAAIAGIHFITFARIHYEQLFGLSPTIICSLAWVAAGALGLPCLTNSSIIRYDPTYLQCLWFNSTMSHKFLAYMLLLGVIIPVSLTYYAYIRILAIFYHSPLVFQALGLFRARYLLFILLLNSIVQAPFFAYLFYDWAQEDAAHAAFLAAQALAGVSPEATGPYGSISGPGPGDYARYSIIKPILVYCSFSHSLTSGALYGPSLFLIKEEDIALTHRANRAPQVNNGPVIPSTSAKLLQHL